MSISSVPPENRLLTGSFGDELDDAKCFEQLEVRLAHEPFDVGEILEVERTLDILFDCLASLACFGSAQALSLRVGGQQPVQT